MKYLKHFENISDIKMPEEGDFIKIMDWGISGFAKLDIIVKVLSVYSDKMRCKPLYVREHKTDEWLNRLGTADVKFSKSDLSSDSLLTPEEEELVEPYRAGEKFGI